MKDYTLDVLDYETPAHRNEALYWVSPESKGRNYEGFNTVGPAIGYHNLNVDSGGTITIGWFRKHEIKYSLPEEMYAFPLNAAQSASQEIKDHPLIRDFSYFYSEAPFTMGSTGGDYMIKGAVYEIRLHRGDPRASAHLPSLFPPPQALKAGTQTKHLEIKGNLSIKIPDISNLPSFGGISFNSLLNGEESWAKSTITDLSYDVILPEVAAGCNGNDYAQWIFKSNPQFSISGGQRPAVIFGIPKGAFKSERIEAELILTVDCVTGTPARVPISVKNL